MKKLVLCIFSLLVLSITSPVLSQSFPLDRTNRQEVKAFFYANYETAFDSSVGWTGNTSSCNPGGISPTFEADTLQLINFYRTMAGLPGEVIFHSIKNEKGQEGALMMHANGRLAHSGWTNSDACYTADGAEALSKSNLSLGAVGPRGVELMMEDSIPIPVYLGHRRLILYPPQIEMGMGATSQYFALWVLGAFGVRPPSPEWVSWPPSGYVPHQIVYPAWSFSAPGAGYSGASVTVRKNGEVIPTTATVLANGYGDNTIGWEFIGGLVAVGPGMLDTTYEVTISNVTGLNQISYTYNVTIFDPAICWRGSGPQDGDLDGSDLRSYIAGGSFVDIAFFADSFGRTDCP
jgi:hypothetical protein